MRLHTGRIRRGSVATGAARIWRRRRHSAEKHPIRTAALWLVALAATFVATSAAAQFTTAPVTGGFINEPYRYDVAATTGTQGTTTIVAATPLPEWLVLETTGDGTAALQGTPTQLGVFRVALRAQSGNCVFFVFFCPTQVFDLLIVEKPNQPPVVVPPGIADVAVTAGTSIAIDVRPAFADPDGDALVFSAAGLPNGISLNAGVITGAAPSVIAEQLFNITVTASDGRGGTVADAFALRISPPSRSDMYVSGVAATPAPATVGAPVDVVVQYGNAGPTPSGNAVLTVTLAGTAFTLTGNTCAVTANGNRQTLTCNVTPVAAGGTGSIALRGSAAAAGDVFVTATISSNDPPDPDAANNSAVGAVNIGTTLVTEPAQTVAVAATRALAGGDLDGDGFDDVVAATVAAEAALLLRSVGDPTGLHATLDVPERANRGLAVPGVPIGDAALGNDAAIADLDNDADLDVVVANGPGRSSTAYRNSAGSLQALGAFGATGSDDRAVALGDVDGDGFVDAVVAREDGVRLYRNVGGTQLVDSAVGAAGTSAIDVLLANLTGTTLPELVVVRGDGSVFFHDNSAGAFGAARAVDAGPASAVAGADFNRDGNGDLVVARTAPNASGVPANTVYAGNGAGAFTVLAELGAAPTIAITVGDLDEDGDADVVAVNATGAHQTFTNAGNGTFTQHARLLVSPNAKTAALARVGVAKRLDLVIGGDEGVRVFFNDGVGNLGLGDLEGPVITLNGTPEVTIQAGGAYTDQGATAMDAVDGPVTPVVDNPVDANIIGTYTVTYTARDRAGNAGRPATRTVHVAARQASGGGGGSGATGVELALLAALAAIAARTGRSLRRRTLGLRGGIA